MSAISTRFTPTTKIGSVCDKTSQRYALSAVQVSPREGGVWLTACDGRVLAAVPAEGQTDSRALCPAEVLPKSKKSAEVTLNGRWESAGKFAEPVDGRFPRCEDVIPQAIDCVKYIKLGLNGAQLKALADALLTGSEYRPGLTLFVPLPESEDRGVERTICVLSETGIGVIMPTNVKDVSFSDYNTRANSYAKDHGKPIA